jgi:Tol biopolymer transport system component/serine/threonine protein kinase
MIGQTLSHYKILEKLGSGGMGEVYVAEDTKLHRNVALKILPPEMASEERRHRFEREAQAIAALNHPNIVTVFSVEEAEGVHFITMELVKGKTVTELISKKGMPLSKFFEVAIPLADAVSAAHEKGIIHRDLKPDNLMVSDEGRLKILDFGLAKLKQEFAQEGISELPTQSPTQEGRVLGTVAYMSPEQAEGKKVDDRSDIFSIGIILYEMATGERPFRGDSAVSTLSSIIRDTPASVTELNPDVPRELSKVIRRCLVKEPGRRYQTAVDLRNELEELKQEVESGDAVEGVHVAKPKIKWLVFATAAAAAVIAGSLGYLLRLSDVTPVHGIESTLTRLTSQTGVEYRPSLSPDGEDFVYERWESGDRDIYRQRVGGQTAFNLTEDSTADDRQPVFSPDGKQIAFRSDREGGGIFLMGATGESVRRLTDSGYNPAWSPDGKKIVYATGGVLWSGGRGSRSQLWTVDVASGERHLVTEGDAVQPSWSPHGHRIAYWSIEDETGTITGERDIWTIPSAGGEAVRVTNDAHVDWNPVWSPDGQYLYFASDRGGAMNLWRVPIEEETGNVMGSPGPVTSGGSASRGQLSLSGSGGRIAYVESVGLSNIWKAAFDPSEGTVVGEPVQVTSTSTMKIWPDPSPDGEWLAYVSRGDIFVMRTDGSGQRQITNDIHIDQGTRWSPDGKRIAFYSNRRGTFEIWTVHPDASGFQQLTQCGDALYPAWSPDGSRLAYYCDVDERTYILDPNKPWTDQTPQALPPVGDGKDHFESFRWSPDGRWLAGRVCDPNGDMSVAVYSLESQQYQRLTDYGLADTWLADTWLPDSRRLLCYGASGEILLVDVQTREAREVLSVFPDTLNWMALSHDGQWLYFTRQSEEADIWMLTLNEE